MIDNPLELIETPCLICGTEMWEHLRDAAAGQTESTCELAQALVTETAALGVPNPSIASFSLRSPEDVDALNAQLDRLLAEPGDYE